MSKEEETNNATTLPESNRLPDVSPDELDERIAELNEEIEQERRWQKFRRKARNLEKLQLANRARRCAYLKSDGQYCKAPAMGQRLFCVFHVRAMDQTGEPQLQVQLLADRQSIQLTLKQIMEQLVTGRMTPQMASPLLRAAYIALASLKPKPKPIKARRAKAVPNDKGAADDERKLQEMTEEELDAELEQLEAEIEHLQGVLKAAENCAGVTPKTAGGYPVQKSG